MEQLQQTLNKATKMGWTYKFIDDTDFTYFICGESHIIGLFENKISYHELFSKDSGLMEFVKWKGVDHERCRNPVEERGGGIGGYFYHGLSDDQYKRRKFHSLEMSDMTAAEKIDYFNTNVYLPGK